MSTNVPKRVGASGRAVAPLLAAVLLVAAACGKVDNATTSTTDGGGDYVVSGVITSGGAALDGVSVDAGTAFGTSAADGKYSLNLTAGQYAVQYSKSGYKDVVKSVFLGSEAQTTVDVEMSEGVATTASSSGGSSGSSSSGTGSSSSSGTSTSADQGETLTVKSGVRLERRVSGSGTLEFDVKGITSSDNKENIAFGYEEGCAWTGGQGGSCGAEWGLRNYKLKTYGVGGEYAGETRYSVSWSKSKTYHVKITWDRGTVRTKVGTSSAQVDGSYPSEWIIGIGWPPGVRDGFKGAVYSNIKWPAGSTEK